MPFNKPDIRQLSAVGSTVGDVYFPQTKLLLPFDGANAATTTSDLSNRNATVTFVGNASISTAQSKFGGSSLYLDGTGDYLNIADTYWNTAISSGDFTIEFWVRLSSTTYQQIFGTRDSGTNGWNVVHYGAGNENSQFLFYFRDSAGWQYLNLGQGTRTTPAQNTWHHVAVTRSSSTWKLFLNGTAEDTVTNANDMVDGAANGLGIGARVYDTSKYVTGYLDDIRITPGIARYTSNFTPPTTAYLTSAGDVNKQILINSTADGVAIGTGGINQARIAKAWVNFNGTGTVAIRGSYNISSITDNGTGYYSINFSSNMTDVNYSAVGMAHEATDSASVDSAIRLYHDSYANVLQVSQVRIATGSSPTSGIQSFVHQDSDAVMVLIFGN